MTERGFFAATAVATSCCMYSFAGYSAEPIAPMGDGVVIFQCAKCNRIIGDSLAIVTTDEDLSIVALRGACSVGRSPKTRTSEEGKDVGSTYHEVFCAGCTAPLGRIYLTTAPVLDHVRSLFTFNIQALRSYELGSYEHALELPTDALSSVGAASSASSSGAAAAASSPVDTVGPCSQPLAEQQMEGLAVMVAKIQSMILVFNDRLSAMEKQTSGGDQPTASKKRK